MCGIAIAINWPDAEAAVKTVLGSILHRGDVTDPILTPLPNSAMGTRRLRIVDGDHAIQPIVSADGRIAIVFNGEIYNYREIKRELEIMGVKFNTDSDTEVVACALMAWGAGAMERFIGMYAFVAVDLDNGQFVAARDPMGVKPLYLIQSAEGYFFCSEIKPLLNISEAGDVLLLPPGYVLTRRICSPFKSRIQQRLEMTVEGDTKKLDELLAEAVRIRLPEGLPVATLFSGGIDSTLIAHYARRFRPEAPGYFLGDKTAPDYQYAARYAEMTGFDLRLVPFDTSRAHVSSLVDELLGTVETFEPEVIRNGLCNYLLAQKIHEDGFRVVLCGEGADELFCGYVPLELIFAEGNELGRPVRDECLNQMHRTSFQRVDRCTMRWQIEARLPFMDPSIINYALDLDAKKLITMVDGEPQGKTPLREVYDLYPNQLPPEIRNRKKIPFNEGAGLDKSQTESPWVSLAEDSVSDADFADGQKKFAAFDLRTKEEFFYIEKLNQKMDVFRVPHLQGRARIPFPEITRNEKLKQFISV